MNAAEALKLSQGYAARKIAARQGRILSIIQNTATAGLTAVKVELTLEDREWLTTLGYTIIDETVYWNE